MAVRDYYFHWALNREASCAGKLLLLDFEDESLHQIFFDDNIWIGSEKDTCIVDVRDSKNGETVSPESVLGKNLVKVEPKDAILDSEYFINEVNKCLNSK